MSFRILQFLVWGVLSCALLAFPSKDYKRYLSLGLLGGLGLAAGQWIWLALGESDKSYAIILGSLLGLFLGINTKKISGVVILVLVGIMAFAIRYGLNSIYYSNEISQTSTLELMVLSLTAGLVGGVIALVFSSLRNEESSQLPKIQA